MKMQELNIFLFKSIKPIMINLQTRAIVTKNLVKLYNFAKAT